MLPQPSSSPERVANAFTVLLPWCPAGLNCAAKNDSGYPKNCELRFRRPPSRSQSQDKFTGVRYINRIVARIAVSIYSTAKPDRVLVKKPGIGGIIIPMPEKRHARGAVEVIAPLRAEAR